jgi:membrane protein YqaA with SNARE-associated domain
MGRIGDWARGLALTLGAPGLGLVAFLDSSFLSLPEITDILVVWMVTRHPARVAVYVLAATAGSLAGCLVMYSIGRKGGEALIRRRFAPASVERAMAAFDRHGVLVVLIPAILPPPAPFKIFVILAGLAGISPARFVTAIVIGRGSRYLVLGLLAIEYGEQTLAYVDQHGFAATMVVIGLLAAAGAGYFAWSKVRRANGR